jgi:hypothetical protein
MTKETLVSNYLITKETLGKYGVEPSVFASGDWWVHSPENQSKIQVGVTK